MNTAKNPYGHPPVDAPKKKAVHTPVYTVKRRDQVEICLNCTLPDCDQNSPQCPFSRKSRARKEH